VVGGAGGCSGLGVSFPQSQGLELGGEATGLSCSHPVAKADGARASGDATARVNAGARSKRERLLGAAFAMAMSSSWRA
jgi:hypothetical protein